MQELLPFCGGHRGEDVAEYESYGCIITAGVLVITCECPYYGHNGPSDDAARTPTAEEVGLAGSIRPDCNALNVIVAWIVDLGLPLLQGTSTHLLAIHGTHEHTNDIDALIKWLRNDLILVALVAFHDGLHAKA